MADFKTIVDLYKEGIKPSDIVEMLKIKKQLETEDPDKKNEPDKKDEADKKDEPDKKDNLLDKDQVDYKKLYEESQAALEKLQKELRTQGGGSDSDNKDGMKSLIEKMRSFH